MERRKRRKRIRLLRSRRDLRGTAIHEAGHAVIGRVLNLICGHATIEADEDSAGHHIIADPWAIAYHWEQAWRQRIEQAVAAGGNKWELWNTSRLYRDSDSVFTARILAYMAGREAEVEILGRCRGGDGDDQYQIALMLKEVDIPGSETDEDAAWEQYEGRLRRQARRLVRRHRALIERVADELLKRHRLEPEEIDERSTPSLSTRHRRRARCKLGPVGSTEPHRRRGEPRMYRPPRLPPRPRACDLPPALSAALYSRYAPRLSLSSFAVASILGPVREHLSVLLENFPDVIRDRHRDIKIIELLTGLPYHAD
jgi:hypothetical protein